MRYISPTELHENWDLIREDLQKHSDGWRPEDVYSCIQHNTSTLHIAEDDGYEGFVVLTPQTHFHGQVLHIWLAYGKNLMEKYLPEIEDMARKIGAKEITFSSRRKGWEKYFTPCMTMYRKEIK